VAWGECVPVTKDIVEVLFGGVLDFVKCTGRCVRGRVVYIDILVPRT
jgi:hypothetical protein